MKNKTMFLFGITLLLTLSFTSASYGYDTGVIPDFSNINNIYIINESQIYHNNLTDLQGGITNQYYHLTNTEHTAVVNYYPYFSSFYNSSDFVISDYYLKSNPFSFYNSTTIPSYILTSNEGNLNVNSSDYWDGLNTPSDINAGDITNDGTYLTSETDPVWSADKSSYSTTTQANALYYAINNPSGFYNSSDFVISDYYLKSNPNNFLNQTNTDLLYAPINYGDNWNKTYADTLYYAITNPFSFYNSTTLVNNSQLTNDLNWINWSQVDNGTFIYVSQESSLNVNSSTYWDGETSQANLNVNSSDYWDGYNNPTEIKAGDADKLDNYDSSFFYPLNTSINTNTNFTGQFDYNGGWTSSGLSIIDGDLYAQTVYAVNFSGLNVNTVSTNGSLYPTMDNQFDLGNQTYRWRDLNLGRNAYIAGNTGIGYTNTGTAKLAVNGNVGIGTTSPGEKLNVVGGSENAFTADITKTAGVDAQMVSTGALDLAFTGDGATGVAGAYTYYGARINNSFTSSDNLGEGTNIGLQIDVSGGDNNYGLIVGTGNVGIGTTSPSDLLEVYASNNPRISVMSDANGKPGYEWVEADTRKWTLYNDNDDKLKFQTDSDVRMTIQQDGKVGIGTTSPESPLHVYAGNSGATVHSYGRAVIEDNTHAGLNILTPNTSNGYILFGDPEDSFVGGLNYIHSSNTLQLMTNNAYRMTIDSSGNVGIGTTSPQNKLNIIGTTNSTGGFAVGANTGLTGNYSVGTCWMAYSGGILYGTNCPTA